MKGDILTLLKDDNEYYNGVGRKYMSNSDIGTLLENPRAYGRVRPDGKNLLEGRYFHKSMIEKDKVLEIPVVDVTTRNTKTYKDFCEANNLEIALLNHEKETIDKCIKAMQGNIAFFESIYHPGNKYEVPAITTIEGVPFKGKGDIITDDSLDHNIDLKSTSDILKFARSARDYNYDSQGYIYEVLFGKPLWFYVVDKGTQQLGIFRPTKEFVDRGREKVLRAIAVYRKYFGEAPSDHIDNHHIELELL
jgi:hypothetical protein